MSGRRKPEKFRVESEGLAQRMAVFERADFQCEFERAVRGLIAGETHFENQRVVEWRADEDIAWVRCANLPVHTAHIFRRWKCGMHPTDDGIPLKFHPLVAVAGCYEHHSQFDSRAYNDIVRVPAVLLEAARRLINHTLEQARARGEGVAEVDLSHT